MPKTEKKYRIIRKCGKFYVQKKTIFGWWRMVFYREYFAGYYPEPFDTLEEARKALKNTLSPSKPNFEVEVVEYIP